MAKRKSKCSAEKGEAEPASKKCKTPLKKQILEEINPATIDYIAIYFFTTGYGAGKRLDLSEREQKEMLNKLLVKFYDLIRNLPEEIMT